MKRLLPREYASQGYLRDAWHSFKRSAKVFWQPPKMSANNLIFLSYFFAKLLPDFVR